jgi:hypothetical protein
VASLHYDQGKGSRRDALALCVVLVVVILIALAAHVEGTSLDPNTGCLYGEILTSDGTCR